MPNGGTDCCGKCCYNKAVQEMGCPDPQDWDRFWDISHCTLRDVRISNPFWTYCDNFRYEEKPESIINKSEESRGWIKTNGMYEKGYTRIPWHGTTEPRLVDVESMCTICRREIDFAIEIIHNGQALRFCTNRHYIKWWVSIHHDISFRPNDFSPPEEIFKKK